MADGEIIEEALVLTGGLKESCRAESVPTLLFLLRLPE